MATNLKLARTTMSSPMMMMMMKNVLQYKPHNGKSMTSLPDAILLVLSSVNMMGSVRP